MASPPFCLPNFHFSSLQSRCQSATDLMQPAAGQWDEMSKAENAGPAFGPVWQPHRQSAVPVWQHVMKNSEGTTGWRASSEPLGTQVLAQSRRAAVLPAPTRPETRPHAVYTVEPSPCDSAVQRLPKQSGCTHKHAQPRFTSIALGFAAGPWPCVPRACRASTPLMRRSNRCRWTVRRYR